jgi:hypothetical protein
MPLCPVIEGQSLLGAFVVVSIYTDADGGTLKDYNGNPIWSVVSGGEVARSVFHAPFLLGSSGTGTASLSNHFGSPFPSEPSIPFENSAMLRHQFLLTTGDRAKFNTSLYIGAGEQSVADCATEYPLGDLNKDGFVNGHDLIILFSQWGTCPDPANSDCPADLNGDGKVDGMDMVILLSNWG